MSVFFKTIGYYLSLPFVFFVFFIQLLSVKRKNKKYQKNAASILLSSKLKTLYTLINKFLYIRRIEIIKENIESIPSKQLFFIANHKSFLDPLIMYKVLYESQKLGFHSFVCKNELSKHWWTRCPIELIDGIFLQRDDGRSILSCYYKQTENIKKGYSILIFPEGTRVYGDTFNQFKSTTLKVPMENMITICPLVIYGADKKTKWYMKKKVCICALKCVQPNEFINLKQDQLMSNLQNKIVEKYYELKSKSK